MNSYRYNPVYKKWYFSGVPIIEPEKISQGMIINPKDKSDFIAVSYPREVLLLDNNLRGESKTINTHFLYKPNPPLGEYDLILYRGKVNFWSMKPQHWEEMLEQLQLRILSMHKNLTIHYLDFTLSTKLLYSFRDYLRVGDLVGASHQIFEDSVELSADLAEKLREEVFFGVSCGKYGQLYAPSAPKYNKEVWYISNTVGGFETANSRQVSEVALYLSKLICFLGQEWQGEDWIIKLHTSIQAKKDSLVWWFQIYSSSSNSYIHGVLPQRLNPEGYVRLLKTLF